MKRKLIDLKDSTFEALSCDAKESGTNLKQYIEGLLDQKARVLEDCESRGYSFSMSREPSDRELAAVMSCAAEEAAHNNAQVRKLFFEDIEKTIRGL